ncbi:MAG: glutamate--tRNA ligase family protein [Desulforhopalus sp.]|jgi:glutamyl-tRNA synthetase|nr:glutamate--tRNA ligase family protein [Desulforhopalus sp.]
MTPSEQIGSPHNPPRSRIAPTPSGHLHLGNAVNFLITWVLVRQRGGRLKLRIDDADSARCRPEYIEDIFRQLDWLGLDWDEGPEGPGDLRERYSQRLRFGRYRVMLVGLRQAGHTYFCGCSRAEIREQVGSGVYPGLCRRRPSRDGDLVERLLVPENTLIEVEKKRIDLASSMGDFVLWRRDDSPAYQLASLADDLDDGINFIVRGSDLLVSSAAQIFLAGLLGRKSFARIRFHHHRLLVGHDGAKLSKSDQALSLEGMRRLGATRRDIYQAAAPYLGMAAEQVGSLNDLRLRGSYRTQE